MNSRTNKISVPELQLPTIEYVVRKVLDWKARYPHAKIKIAKRDVERASKKMSLEP